MRSADDGAEVVRILYAIEDDVHALLRDRLLKRGEPFGRSESYNSLMGHSGAGSIEHFARLVTNGNAAFAGQIDDLLHARSGGTFGDKDTIKRPAGPERFPDGMDS